jgi:hypothetical protein
MTRKLIGQAEDLLRGMLPTPVMFETLYWEVFPRDIPSSEVFRDQLSNRLSEVRYPYRMERDSDREYNTVTTAQKLTSIGVPNILGGDLFVYVYVSTIGYLRDLRMLEAVGKYVPLRCLPSSSDRLVPHAHSPD